MAFEFVLAPLLRLRQSVERQLMLTLQETALRLARERENVARLDRFLIDAEKVDADSLLGGRASAELRFAESQREELWRLRVRMQAEVARLAALREQAADAYQSAFREREVLDSLCARQRRAYEVDKLRREQRRLDAAFLLQRWHRRG
jgi:flagellar export protein FliJ